MSFLQQAFSPFIGRRSKKKKNEGRKDKREIPQTYPYYPDPVVRYRRENSPFTASFPQEPTYDESTCSSGMSFVQGWHTHNGFVPSRPLSPTFSNESFNYSTASSRSSAKRNGVPNGTNGNSRTPVTPGLYTPSPGPIFLAESEITLARSPSPSLPYLNSNSTTPCPTPAPSLAPLSRIPNKKMVSPSPDRYSSDASRCSNRRSTTRPPPCPASSTRSVGVQTPVMGRRMILPGGATPVLGRRGVVGVVKSSPNCRESSYSQCSFQTCSDYKPREATSLFRALSLTPKVRRRKKYDDESSCSRCSTATLTENTRATASALSVASTLTDFPTDVKLKSNREELISRGSDAAELKSLVRSGSVDRSVAGSVQVLRSGRVEEENKGVVEVRVGEAGLVRRRKKNRMSGRHDGLTTSVRVSIHQQTWHCLPLSNKGKCNFECCPNNWFVRICFRYIVL